MKIRIAVASSDGLNVDQHFGRAQHFRIYQLNENNFDFIEERISHPPCSEHQHSDHLLDQAAEHISDCQGVIACQIGPGAVDVLLIRRILPFTMEGSVDEALKTLLATNRFKHLRSKSHDQKEK